MHACNACVRATRACDYGRPCEACRHNSSECDYARPELGDDSSVGHGDGKSQQSENNDELESPSHQAKNSDDSYPRIRIDFLLNYTKPVQHYQSIADFFTTFPTSNDATPLVNEDILDTNYITFEEGFIQSCMPTTLDADYEWDEITSSTSFAYLDACETRLQARLTELAHQLSLIRDRGNHLSSKPDFSAATILTARNLMEAKRLFFSNWNRECPFLHEATFNLETVSLPLIFAVMLVGLAYSEKFDGPTTMQPLHDLAEVYAFSSGDFLQILQGPRQGQRMEKKSLEAVQAVILVSALQNWKNDIITRRRIRTIRYSQIMSAARILGLIQVKNDHASREFCVSGSFDWEAYITAETSARYEVSYISGAMTDKLTGLDLRSTCSTRNSQSSIGIRLESYCQSIQEISHPPIKLFMRLTALRAS